MFAWLTGIGIAGFFIGLGMVLGMRPARLAERRGHGAVVRWWVGGLAIAGVGVGGAALTGVLSVDFNEPYADTAGERERRV